MPKIVNDQSVVKELAETFRMAMRGYAGSIGIVTPDADQTEIATACSSSKDRERRFELARFGEREGVPYLLDAQACLFWDQDGNYTYGTQSHSIGTLVAAKTHGAVDPLLHVDGRDASLQIA